MKARLVFVVLAMVGVGCAASGDTPGVTKKDSGHGDAISTTDGGTDEDAPPTEETGSIPIDDSGLPVDTGTEPDDTSIPPDDTSIPPDDTGTPPIDTGVVDTGTPTETGTTGTAGTACSSDSTCDPTGLGDFVCSKGAFGSAGGNDIYPSNVCVGISCAPGDGTTIETCDSDAGLCLPSGTSGICLGACNFDDSTTAPTGCVGKDACNAYGFGTDSAGKAFGVGYCFGGCKADADCGSGQACQREDGLCVASASKVTYAKTVGTACTNVDATSTPAKCNCLYATATNKGYCSQFCKMGSSGDCPTGYSCDAQLPKTKVLSTDVVFTSAPTGIAGYCLKNCTTDADCTAINGYCDQTAGVAGKTCQIGSRRCSSTAPCPTGKTCSGATSTTAGTCI